MPESPHPIAELLRQDKRYKLEAYAFVFEALNYAHEVLHMGKPSSGNPSPAKPEETPRRGKATRPGKSSSRKAAAGKSEPAEDDENAERHLTGQELCEAIRLYALEQFGYMAQCVLNSWGIQKTGDFGEIVFNLIRIGQMRKTSQDRREDFDDVFDFEAGLRQSFQIKRPE
jgi:uncharacterized repeat protein (TIGR04138 family)